MLVAVVGPSGAGKDTLLAAARARLAADPRFVFVRRSITRPAAAGGEDHLPLSRDDFAAARDSGGFALWWEAHGLLYGIPSDMEVDAGRVAVVNLSRRVLVEAAARWATRVLLVTAPRAILATRLAARGRESPGDIARRLAREAPLPAGLDVVTITNDGPVEVGAAHLLDALIQAAADARRSGTARRAPPA